VNYLIRRLFHAVLVLFAVVSIVFILGRVVGDPVRIVLGVEVPEERVQMVRDQLGLNDPLPVQYVRFVSGALTLDFGESFWQKVPALPLVVDRLPATFALTGVVFLMAVPLGITLGTLAALYPDSILDRIISIFSMLGVSMVDFWLALMLILLFAVQLGWFKTSGYGGFQYIMLPALTLAVQPFGRVAQITRSAMLDQFDQPHIGVARAKGLRERRIVFLHAMKNAAVPIATIAGDTITSVLNGSVLIETIFAWPGVGQLTLLGLGRRDLPLVEATVFIIALMVVAVNLVVDMSYAYLNPRIRYQ
ncbi:MAG: ABC transporter permease, partial [Chloroflexota bacterium]